MTKRLWVSVVLFACVGCVRAPSLASAPTDNTLMLTATASSSAKKSVRKSKPKPRYVILMIADGWGYKHIEATRSYTGDTPPYDDPKHGFEHRAMVTTNSGEYDPERAWKDFPYLTDKIPNSATTATAMYSGTKTNKKRISANPAKKRLMTISEMALAQGFSSGVVTTAPISHATPGAWLSHNLDRNNARSIAGEGLFGDPKQVDGGKGGLGKTSPLAQVLIGGGHPEYAQKPAWRHWVGRNQFEALEKTQRWTIVERDREKNGGEELLKAARRPETRNLLGLFGGSWGRLRHREGFVLRVFPPRSADSGVLGRLWFARRGLDLPAVRASFSARFPYPPRTLECLADYGSRVEDSTSLATSRCAPSRPTAPPREDEERTTRPDVSWSEP